MAEQRKPVVAVTMGDPCGIGPEVIAKALSSPEVYETCRPLIIGNGWCMERALELVGSNLKLHRTNTPLEPNGASGAVELLDPGNLNAEDVTVGRISPTCGKAAMEWVAAAGELAMAGQIDAIATAPVNKEAASLAGYSAIGHTELFQELAGSPTVATMLMSGSLRVVHLTTHRSLRRALDYVTKDRILTFLQLTHDTFGRWGMPNPRIGVAALNPHGSDGGLLGPRRRRGDRPSSGSRLRCWRQRHRTGASRQRVSPSHQWQVRRSAGHVPRSRPHSGKGAWLRAQHHRQPRPALHTHLRRPRHRLRHRGARHSRPPEHDRGHQAGPNLRPWARSGLRRAMI